jgi:hypothetical protein
VISLISIIGIPIGFPLLWSIPLLGYALPWLALALGLKIWAVPRPFILSLIFVLIAPQVYGLLSNATVNRNAARLLVADTGPLPLPGARPDTLVFIKSEEKIPKSYTMWCDWVCQQILFEQKAAVVGIGYHTPERKNTEYDLPAQQPYREVRFYALRAAETCKIASSYETGTAHWLDLPGFLFNSERRAFWTEQRQSLFDQKKLCLTELTGADIPTLRLVIDYTEVRERGDFSALIPNLQRLQIWQEDGVARNLLLSRTLARIKRLELPILLQLEIGAEFRSHYEFMATETRFPNPDAKEDNYFSSSDLVKNKLIGAFLQEAGYLPTLAMTGVPPDPREE